ncbi:MAG: hypothetical protein AB1551_02440 [Actinomycetota bacterium]
MDGRLALPQGLSGEERRAVVVALERYLIQGSLPADPWVLAGRMKAMGHGILQARRYTDGAWRACGRAPFVRPGVPSLSGRGDAR